MKPGGVADIILFPITAAGRILRRAPLSALQLLLDLAVANIMRSHPDIMERFGDVDFPTYLIDPTDLPVRFFLQPRPERPELRILTNRDDVEASAKISGTMLSLLDLMEGRLDGDALFFSRALTVTGDTAAVVALRNAIDSADIDLLSDALPMLGPVAPPLSRLARRVAALPGELKELGIVGPSRRRSR